MIIIQMSQEQRIELERFRGQSSSRNSEKALMVLMNADGESANYIAGRLNRNPHTVRLWLKRYLAEGLVGLQRKYSPGRSRKKRKECIRIMEDIIPQFPQEFNYPDSVWSIPLIKHYLGAMHGLKVSKDTIVRGLKGLGYSYKRPSKTVSPEAPSPEEKRVAVEKMVVEIGKLLREKPVEIVVLDESHFSNQPYLVRGWLKKRWPPQDSKFRQKRKSHLIWRFKFKDWAFLLEAIQAG